MISLQDSNIRVLDIPEKLDYFDLQSQTLPHRVSPLQAWQIVMSRKMPLLKAAFWVRDFISNLFGVKKIGGFTGDAVETVQVGDHLDFFLVEYVDDDVLILTERERHLDVMTCISSKDHDVSITSSVVIHNWFGRLYMLPVGIGHRWIVRSLLRYLNQQVRQH